MKKFVFIAAILAAFASCNSANNEEPTTGTAVEFTGGIATRAGGTEWAEGDKIGIYMFESGTTTVSEESGNVEHYNSSAAGATANFDVVDTANTIYYPEGDVAVDFLAYYPYSSTLVGLSDFVYELDVNSSSQVDQPLIDLMVSTNLTGKTLSKTALALEFSHALSQLNFVVESGVGSPSLDGLAISISGLINSASYDLPSGSITLGDSATALVVSGSSAIIIPQTASLVFTITTTDNSVGFDTSATSFTFVAGQATTITLTLNRTGVTFGDEESTTGGTITDWTTSSTDIDAK